MREHPVVDLGEGQELTARVQPRDNPVKGEPFHLSIDTSNLYFFDPNTGVAIYWPELPPGAAAHRLHPPGDSL